MDKQQRFLDQLDQLGVKPTKWGKSFRVKTKNEYGRQIFTTKLNSEKAQKLFAKFHKLKLKDVKQTFSSSFKKQTFVQYVGKAKSTYSYENISEGSFYNKLKDVLTSQDKAFKFNIQLHYTLIDRITKKEFDFFATERTEIYDTPISINSKRDISKTIAHIASLNKADKLPYPSSSAQLKAITGFKIVIYHRQHELGKNIEIPKAIKENRYVIDFPETNNKCILFCIGYKLQDEKPLPKRMAAHVKDVAKAWCEFKNIPYTSKYYKDFQPIDILHFDELEECFKMNIDVFELSDDESIKKIRESSTQFDKTINILDYKSHAMYITDLNKILKKHPCPKCTMFFTTSEKLRNHTKNRCEETVINRFVSTPTRYRPQGNFIKGLLSKFYIKGCDHYMDHYIVYDFEALLKSRDHNPDDRTRYTHDHKPLSVSVCDSLSNNVQCFVNESPRHLLEEMFEYIYSIQKMIAKYNRTKLNSLISILSSKGNELKEMGADKNKNNYYLKMLKKVLEFCEQIPLIGFNSGRYDINLVKRDLFDVLGTESVSFTVKNPSYMCIATDRLRMLDISNYLPAGTSYDSYLSTYSKGCQCEDKIRCLCGLSKGFFCYEYIDSFDRIYETSLPPRSAFDSKLKNTKCSEEEYERLKFVWSHYEMKSIKDLLIWYNNLDVKPFITAINAHREQFKTFGLDTLIDGISLPSLAEKVMYEICYSGLTKPPTIAGSPFKFPQSRFASYEEQDIKEGREYELTIGHLNTLLCNQSYSCGHCGCPLNEENASADRINNFKGHINGNIIMSCTPCNVQRKRMSVEDFQSLKTVEHNKDKLVHSIDEEQSEIFHKMRENIAGGPSIIFKRYAESFKTPIRNGPKMCEKVIGYDANALYLWCLGNQMPCGRLEMEDVYDGIVDDIMTDKKFGFLECDIETPEHLKTHFSEMTPIFKNTLIDCNDSSIIGDHMFDYNQAKETGRAKPAKKLIGSYKGDKILIYTPLLKWYIDHGLVITKTYSFIKANPHRAFKEFMDKVSDARRAGDVDKSKAMVAEMMKLIGNSAFGRSGMDKRKHKQVMYVSGDEKIKSITEKNNFNGFDELNESYEVSMNKRIIKLNNPIHLSIAIYQLAKLRMLEFYYDCIDKYIPRECFELLEMDTDSNYFAFSDAHPFENLVKSELKDHFEAHKNEWFPRDGEYAKYDRRTAGLFKEEWRGDGMVSLSSKNYICYLPDAGNKQKCSAKGVQQSGGKNADILNPESFKRIVSERITMEATNSGFRINKCGMSTYIQIKTGLNYFYDKRRVLEDGITTVPLDI
ncbi:hypothetical protein PybrP1_000619 [[Pythium] brassicae (nom. inval.)]|nr:hypothetical protein PybrP1_000619 [[Pythium] brassicae (nom. inval.)]